MRIYLVNYHAQSKPSLGARPLVDDYKLNIRGLKRFWGLTAMPDLDRLLDAVLPSVCSLSARIMLAKHDHFAKLEVCCSEISNL